MTKRWVGSAQAALLLVLAFGGGPSRRTAMHVPCQDPRHGTSAAPHVGRHQHGPPLSLVALGSFSTAGAGASTVDASYPTRLRARLSSLFGHPVIVVNRGRNGDRVGDMLLRLPEVISEHPDAVIWQLGTNALLTGL